METAIARINESQTSLLIELIDKTEGYQRKSKSERTLKEYRSDWRQFTAWCEAHNLSSLPASPQTIAGYLAAHAEVHKVSTLTRRLAAISVAHKAAGYDTPVSSAIVAETMKGIKRTVGTAQKQKSALRVKHIKAIIQEIPTNTIRGKRDRAILLVGYTGALRRSEISAVNVSDVQFTDEGAIITIPKSKTDQDGRGQEVVLSYGTHEYTCPVRALKAWLETSGIVDGPVFRPINRHGQVQACRLSGKSLATIIKALADICGLEEAGGHSLRAGFITDQYHNGTPEAVIMKQSRHTSRTVLQRYYREANRFAFNYAAAVGL